MKNCPLLPPSAEEKVEDSVSFTGVISLDFQQDKVIELFVKGHIFVKGHSIYKLLHKNHHHHS